MGDESTGLGEEHGDAGFHVACNAVIDSFPGTFDDCVDLLGGDDFAFCSSVRNVGAPIDEEERCCKGVSD